MEWQRLSIIVRLFCLLVGGVGSLGIAWMLLSNMELLKEQPTQTLVFLAMAGVGGLAFLAAGIIGKFPNPQPNQMRSKE